MVGVTLRECEPQSLRRKRPGGEGGTARGGEPVVLQTRGVLAERRRPVLLVEHALHERSDLEAVRCRNQVDRAAHAQDTHGLSLLQQVRDLASLEVLDAAPP